MPDGTVLSEAQVRQFKDHGWLAPMRALSPEQAAEGAAGIARLEQATGMTANAFLKIKAYLAAPWMVDLARNPALLDAVEAVMGPDILLFGASIFAKAPQDGLYVSWHQDSAYFGLEPHEEVTAWVALTRSTKANGCLRVLPDSHRQPDLRHVETYAPSNMLARGQTIEGIDETGAVDIELEPGQFSLHHERTAHASGTNRTDERRIGLAFFFVPTHVQSPGKRRTATLVRGVDRYGHWDPDPLPTHELDPVAFAALRGAWGSYRDGQVRQAAESAA